MKTFLLSIAFGTVLGVIGLLIGAFTVLVLLFWLYKAFYKDVIESKSAEERKKEEDNKTPSPVEEDLYGRLSETAVIFPLGSLNCF